MAKMKELWENINFMLETRVGSNWMSCQEIADELGCPVEWVNEIAEKNWNETIGDTYA